MVHTSFFTLNLGLGGAERVIVNLTSELADRGRDVEIVLAEKKGELLKQVHKNVSVIDLNAEPFIPMIPALRSYIEERQPDILLSTVNTANLAAILAMLTTRSNTRHIIRMANTPSEKERVYHKKLTDRPIPYLMKLLYPFGHEFITISEGLANDLVENYKINHDKISTIYNPCVTDEMLRQGNEPISCNWFSDPEVRVVLGVGSLTEQKDFQTLIKAFSVVRGQNKKYKLVILGEGPQRNDLESLCSKLSLEDDVCMPGEIDNPYPYMNDADLFVLSSRWEGFGIVTVEAMAFGTPVIATDCPYGPSEILENGKYGTLVPTGNAKALAEAIQTTASDPVDETLLYHRASDFHIENIATEYEQILY